MGFKWADDVPLLASHSHHRPRIHGFLISSCQSSEQIVSHKARLATCMSNTSSPGMDQRLCLRSAALSWPRRMDGVAKFSLLGRGARPPPRDGSIYIYTGGPSRVAKIDSRRCCSSDLLPSSPSFPSSQPRARREGEEEIRRTRDGEDTQLHN